MAPLYASAIIRFWLIGACALGCIAPQTRAGEAHPDFSGVWVAYGAGPLPLLGTPPNDSKLPFTAEGRRKVQALRAIIGNGEDRPGNYCLGSGMPESMLFSGATGQYPMEIVQRPDLILILYESHMEVRHLYLGHKIIAEADRLPARNGYSAAHWDGGTLVVETTALKEQEDEAYPHSEQAQILERYQLAADDKGEKVLTDTWTLTDPVFYTEPVRGVKRWVLDTNGILLPYDCTEQFWVDHLDSLRKAKVEKKR